MPESPAAAARPVPAAPAKPPWRYAAERRLGRLARRLSGAAEAEIPLALAIVGREAALAATRADGWALACLERAADCADGSEQQGAWVLLAACRPTPVRRAILGAPNRPSARNRHAGGRAQAPRSAANRQHACKDPACGLPLGEDDRAENR